jgi:hypothetical protein
MLRGRTASGRLALMVPWGLLLPLRRSAPEIPLDPPDPPVPKRRLVQPVLVHRADPRVPLAQWRPRVLPVPSYRRHRLGLPVLMHRPDLRVPLARWRRLILLVPLHRSHLLAQRDPSHLLVPRAQ